MDAYLLGGGQGEDDRPGTSQQIYMQQEPKTTKLVIAGTLVQSHANYPNPLSLNFSPGTTH